MDTLPQELVDKIKYLNPHPVAAILKKRICIFQKALVCLRKVMVDE